MAKRVVLVELQIPWPGSAREVDDQCEFIQRLLKPWFPEAKINGADDEWVPEESDPT